MDDYAPALDWWDGTLAGTMDYADEPRKELTRVRYTHQQGRLCPLCWLERGTKRMISDSAYSCHRHKVEMARIRGDIVQTARTMRDLIWLNAPQRCWWWRF